MSDLPSGSILDCSVIDNSMDRKPFRTDAVLVKPFVEQKLMLVHVLLAFPAELQILVQLRDLVHVILPLIVSEIMKCEEKFLFIAGYRISIFSFFYFSFLLIYLFSSMSPPFSISYFFLLFFPLFLHFHIIFLSFFSLSFYYLTHLSNAG